MFSVLIRNTIPYSEAKYIRAKTMKRKTIEKKINSPSLNIAIEFKSSSRKDIIKGCVQGTCSFSLI